MEIIIAIASILFVAALMGIYTVQQQSAVVIERFGKFLRISEPGLHFLIPFVDKKAGSVSLRVNQLDVKIETKTEDNVFLHALVSVQFYVHPDKVYEAFYKLEDPTKQIIPNPIYNSI